MTEFTKDELEEAYKALASTLQKCEKIEKGKQLGKSQETLLTKRIKALRIALALLEREMDKGLSK